MNKDQVRGRTTEIQGKIKQVTGKIIGNKNMEENGTIEKNAGKAQAKLGDIKHDLKKRH